MLNLKIENLSKMFNQPLLEEVSTYHSGSGVIALIGDNGSGKSTLLKILANLESQDSGRVVWSGGIPSIGYMKQEIDTNPTLSGGQKKLVILSELIYTNMYDVILLDEPDNHLDLEGKAWLAQAVKDFAGLVILISHDRAFLKTVSTEVWLVEGHSLRTFTCGFEKFEEMYEQELGLKQKMYEEQLRQHKHLSSQVEAFRIKAKYSNKLVGRYHNFEKRLARLEAEMIEDPNKQKASIVLHSKSFGRQIKGKMAITVRDMCFGYDKPIFDHAELYVPVGSKAALVSPNGSGKSTLIKLLLSQLSPHSGVVQIGNDLKVGYYSQEHLETLEPQSTPLLTFMERFSLREYQVDAIMKRFMFSKQITRSRIYTLSGGQKARLQLALFLYTNPDLLILDEPTNHLDLKSVLALEDFLKSFSGTVLLISHDQELVTHTCTEVYGVVAGKITPLKS